MTVQPVYLPFALAPAIAQLVPLATLMTLPEPAAEPKATYEMQEEEALPAIQKPNPSAEHTPLMLPL